MRVFIAKRKSLSQFGIYLFITLILFFNSLLLAQSITFAWISDTHLGSTTGEDDIINSVNNINSLKNMDFIILSGDITETGKTSDIELSKKILDSLNKPYYIIPGNHDTKWSESGCTKFLQIFGNGRFVFDYGGIRFVGLHQGPIMRMGDGQFSPENLRWLDSTLSKISNTNLPIIFVTHYPLDNSIDNWYEVTDRLRKLNTKAVLCGHGHANRSHNFEGFTGVKGRSNLRARQNIDGYNIVRVIRDSIFFSENIPGHPTDIV
jgi:3',5'-cyclic AMP phosphodiesterase CpdA